MTETKQHRVDNLRSLMGLSLADAEEADDIEQGVSLGDCEVRAASGSTLVKAAAHDVSGESRDNNGQWTKSIPGPEGYPASVAQPENLLHVPAPDGIESELNQFLSARNIHLEFAPTTLSSRAAPVESASPSSWEQASAPERQKRVAHAFLKVAQLLDSILPLSGKAVNVVTGAPENLTLKIADLKDVSSLPDDMKGGGFLRGWSDPEASSITIDVTSPETFLHEYAHFIDTQSAVQQVDNPDGYNLATEGLARGDAGAWKSFAKEVADTPGYHKLTWYAKEETSPEYVEYLSQPEEVFARFFEGWVFHEAAKRGVDLSALVGSDDEGMTPPGLMTKDEQNTAIVRAQFPPLSFSEYEKLGAKMVALCHLSLPGSILKKAAAHDVSGEKRDADGKWAKLTEGLPPEAAEKVVQLAGVAEAISAYKEKGTLAPKFIDWFGDWVNDKPRASKVLDADGKPAKSKPTHSVVEVRGKPVIVYHGTANGGFESFDKARQDPQSLFGPGFYFTQAEDVAGSYKDKGMEITHLSRNATQADVNEVRAWMIAELKKSKTADNASWLTNLLAHTENAYDLGLILGRKSLVSSKFRAMLGIELINADNNQEVKHVYLNIRNPIDMDKSLTGEQVESVRLSLEAHGYKCKPSVYGGRTSYLAHAPGRKGVLRITQDGNKTGSDLFDEASSYFRSGQPLYDHNTDDKAMLETTQFLKDAGFDGITHIGGIIHGTKKHKVWIAFEPNQIKAVDNDGEFDPATDNIYKGVALSKSAHDVSGESRDKNGLWVRGSGIPRVPPAELAKTYSDAVQSSAFKAWFGNWDTGEGSKVKGKDGKPAVNTHTHSVVEEGGVPVVVFHGTSHGGFRTFDPSKFDYHALWGAGFYFTQDMGVGTSYKDKGSVSAEILESDAVVMAAAEKYVAQKADVPKFAQTVAALTEWIRRNNIPELRGMFERNPPLARDAGLTHHRIPAELKKAFLNIRNPLDLDTKIGEDGLQSIAEAWNNGGLLDEYQRPAARFIPSEEGGKPMLSLWRSGGGEPALLSPDYNGADVYDEADNMYGHQKATYQTLKNMGFDGLTHIGGNRMGGGNSHRVWIAWEPNQIKAVENEGTFDPASEDMYKGAKAIVIANCPPLTKGVPLEAEKQEHLASTPSGQLPSGQDAYAAMDLRLQQEMARCAMQYDGAREELATTHAGLGPKLKKAMQLMEKLRKPVELLLSGKGPGLTPKVAKACVAYLEAGAEVAKMKMAMRQSYPATVKPGEEKLGGVPGDGPVPDPDPDRLSKAAVAEARVPAGSPGGGRWTDGVLPIAGLEKYGMAKKPVNRKTFDPEVQYHPVTDQHFVKNDPRMILYHGDSRGGAVAPTHYDVFGNSKGQASKQTHIDDLHGFYTAPAHNYAMRFTLRFSGKPGGGISAWRLDSTAKIADENELGQEFLGCDEYAKIMKDAKGNMHSAMGQYAKEKGYDVILRRDDGNDTDEYNPSHPPMSDAEVIVLNQSHLIPVGPGEDGVDMGPAPKKVRQGDFLNGNKKWDEVPLAPPPEDVVPPLYPDIPNALKGAQVLILDPAGVWSRVARTLLRKGADGEGEKGDYVLAIASHPGSAKGQSVRGMSTEHNRTLHNIGYNSATKRIRTLDNLGIDHEVTDHLGHSSTSQWGLEPNMHIKLKGVTHESAQRVGAMFGKAFKQDGIGIAHTGVAATAGNHHEVLGVSKKDGSAYSLDEVNRAGEHAGRHGVSVETSEDHKRLDFHHYGGDGDSWEKGVRSTLHTAGMDGPQHQAAESAVSGEYLDRKDYETSLWGHSKMGGTRQPGAFVHAAQSLARSHTAALGGRSFGQHRPAGPHIPSVRRPGPTTMPGRY